MLVVKVFFLTVFLTIHATPVLNGDRVLKDEQFPYVVRLDIEEKIKYKGKILTNSIDCTGILVQMDVVVTAAHCLDDEYGKPRVKVSAGAVNLKTGSVIRAKMIDYRKHKDFAEGDMETKQPYLKNDIAIVWLDRSFQHSSKIGTAPLSCGEEHFTNKIGSIVGWGETTEDEETTTLRKGQLKVISEDNCQKQIASALYNQFCTIDVFNQFPGEGDSGAPLVINGLVLGLTSWTPLRKPSLTVFLRIQKYLDFINFNLKNGPPNLNKPRKSDMNNNLCKKKPESPSNFQNKKLYGVKKQG